MQRPDRASLRWVSLHWVSAVSSAPTDPLVSALTDLAVKLLQLYVYTPLPDYVIEVKLIIKANKCECADMRYEQKC